MVARDAVEGKGERLDGGGLERAARRDERAGDAAEQLARGTDFDLGFLQRKQSGHRGDFLSGREGDNARAITGGPVKTADEPICECDAPAPMTAMAGT